MESKKPDKKQQLPSLYAGDGYTELGDWKLNRFELYEFLENEFNNGHLKTHPKSLYTFGFENHLTNWIKNQLNKKSV